MKLNRREGRGIFLVTAGFIAASAVLHVLLGGALPRAQWRVTPSPSERILTYDILLRTPPPTTMPPSPQPSPTPKPTILRRHVGQKLLVRPVRHASKPPNLPPAQVAAVVTSSSPDAVSPASSPPEVASGQPSSPVDETYVIVSARFIHEVHPQYPRDAIENGEMGTVIVLLTVGPQGVSDVRVWVSSGYPSLDLAALEAAKESTYSVPEHNGEPATETYRVIYTFSLDS